jgi:hypothetical protein
MENLTNHVMNSTATSAGGYPASEMYTFVHNTVLPNLRKSGLNITSCDLVSRSIWDDIVSKTVKRSATIVGGEEFWLTDSHMAGCFSVIDINGSTYDNGHAGASYGVRPLITVVK